MKISTKVVKNAEWNEYIVKVWDENGERVPAADYHTDCRLDARDTAREMERHAFEHDAPRGHEVDAEIQKNDSEDERKG